MRALVDLAMRGRVHAAIAAASLFVLGMALVPGPAAGMPMLGMMLGGLAVYASGAVIALAALRFGWLEGGVVALGALLVASASSVLFAGAASQAVAIGCLNWLPALVGAEVLRRHADLGAALGAIGAAGALAWLALVTFSGPPAVHIEPWLAQHWSAIEANLAQAGQAPAISPDLALVARVLGEVMAASLITSVVLTLLVARWWHAMLDNPGGFGAEFREMRLPRIIAWTVATAMLVALVAGDGLSAMAGGLVSMGMMLFAFQGIAVAHALVKLRGAGRGWLVAFYLVTLVMTPYSAAVLAVAGFADSWFDYRKRAARRT